MSSQADEAADEAADELYALDPAEFTEARDERANRAHDAGDRQAAAAIRRLRRPSTSAWLVNMLVRRHPDEMAELANLGEALRFAQAELSGEDLRRLAEQRRELVGRLIRLAGTLAAELGRHAGDAVLQQIEGILNAALVDEQAAEEVAAGRLTKPLQAEAAFGLAAPTSRSPDRAERPPRTAKTPAKTPAKTAESAGDGRDALAGARRALEDAEAEAEQRAREAEQAAARLRETSERVDELTAAVRQAREQRSDADRRARAARRAREHANRTVEEARRRVERAQERLDGVSEPS